MNSTADIFSEFPEDSRVWLYQTDRALTEEEVKLVNHKLDSFVQEWAAHGNKLWANAQMINPYFAVISVNDKLTPPSGCSIDASVRKLKEIGQLLGVDFFTRLKVTLLDQNDEIKQIDFADFQNASSKHISKIFDPLVDSLGELRTNWPRKVEESSLSKFVK